MCPTILQLSRGVRKKKHKSPRARAFAGAPHRKGVVYKMLLCLLVNLIQLSEPS